VLLGVVHGHFPLRPDQFTATVLSSTVPTSRLRYGEDFNSGIAVVIPAKEILNLLGQKRLVAQRVRCKEELPRSV
jgi:hypothetical protein